MKLSAARKDAFLAYLRTALDSDDPHVIADALAVVGSVLRSPAPGSTADALLVPANDGPALAVALLDLARAGGLDLSSLGASSTRDLRDALDAACVTSAPQLLHS